MKSTKKFLYLYYGLL